MVKSEPNLGRLCAEDARRDAVHIAVAPVVAGKDLEPGQWVTIQDGVAWPIYASSDRPHGVVDPFLDRVIVKAGQRFWVFLTPGTITGLRHVWSHPAFVPQVPKVKEVGGGQAE